MSDEKLTMEEAPDASETRKKDESQGNVSDPESDASEERTEDPDEQNVGQDILSPEEIMERIASSLGIDPRLRVTFGPTTKIHSFIEGQLVQVIDSKDKTWCYGAVSNVFDDRIEIATGWGYRIMQNFDKHSDEYGEKFFGMRFAVEPLHRYGRPVMAKRSWRGKYILK